MNFAGKVLLVVVALSASSVQQPTFFPSTFKGLNGIDARRTPHDKGEIRAAYYYDQTVAVVDVGNDNVLHNCDLVEVYEPAEADEVLRNLSSTLQPQHVSFQDMLMLMQRCELLDRIQAETLPPLLEGNLNRANRAGMSSFVLFSGILPGTKWCGAGDIAENYHDLGQEAEIDRCCRTHDLCPVKVRAQQTRYNLTNYSIYTKSHCTCDKSFHQCLKTAKHPTANLMGQIYFNFIRVPCIEDVPRSGPVRAESKKRFSPVKMGY